jgi:hypothetical protein
MKTQMQKPSAGKAKYSMSLSSGLNDSSPRQPRAISVASENDFPSEITKGRIPWIEGLRKHWQHEQRGHGLNTDK